MSRLHTDVYLSAGGRDPAGARFVFVGPGGEPAEIIGRQIPKIRPLWGVDYPRSQMGFPAYPWTGGFLNPERYRPKTPGLKFPNHFSARIPRMKTVSNCPLGIYGAPFQRPFPQPKFGGRSGYPCFEKKRIMAFTVAARF